MTQHQEPQVIPGSHSEHADSLNQTLQNIRNRIASGKQPEHKLTDSRTYIRGWNEALAHVEKWIKEETGEKPKS